MTKASQLLIEQAIFTSTQSSRLDGYQVAAHSPGVDPADLRELAVWGPSHDSLLETGDDALSINFHPLPSGAFCVSKTAPAGSEYSGRSGPKIYTQCFVVPRDVLNRFANNPFTLLNAAFAQGSLKVHDRLPDQLEPFRLAGRTAAVDRALLAQLLHDPGPAWLGAMVEAAISTDSLALIAGANGIRWIAGIINCLPPECRLAFSFSTGLRHSPRRPFRIVCLSDDPSEQRKLLRQQNVTLLEVAGSPPQCYARKSGWGGFVSASLAAAKIGFLAQELAQARLGLSPLDLQRLGDELLGKLAIGSLPRGEEAPHDAGEPVGSAISSAPQGEFRRETPPAASAPAAGTSPDEQRRADAAHHRFLRALQTAAEGNRSDVDLVPDPADVLGSHCPAAIEQLEQLDDTVFEAIAGKPGALEQLRKLWPQVLSALGPELLEESREQYVRHALRVWRECLEGDQIRNPALAVTAMDVVCVLFDE